MSLFITLVGGAFVLVMVVILFGLLWFRLIKPLMLHNVNFKKKAKGKEEEFYMIECKCENCDFKSFVQIKKGKEKAPEITNSNCTACGLKKLKELKQKEPREHKQKKKDRRRFRR